MRGLFCRSVEQLSSVNICIQPYAVSLATLRISAQKRILAAVWAMLSIWFIRQHLREHSRSNINLDIKTKIEIKRSSIEILISPIWNRLPYKFAIKGFALNSYFSG